MARFSSILLVYFIIGATMWGGGAIVWDDTGVGEFIIDEPDNFDNPEEDGINSEASGILERLGQPIQNIVGTVGGGLIAAWNLLTHFIGYLFWPITVLQSAGAPPRVVVLGGGSLVVAFYGSFIRTIRTSA